jgi:hypothetical protein
MKLKTLILSSIVLAAAFTVSCATTTMPDGTKLQRYDADTTRSITDLVSEWHDRSYPTVDQTTTK